MTTTGDIRLELLGPSRVVTDGKIVSAFRSNRIPALLGYLAAHPGSVSRERVADALWPHLSEEAGRHNLRQTLVYVRQLLGPTSILTDRSSLELGAGVESDVRALLDWDDAIGIPNGDALVRRVRGPFLGGVDDEWAVEPRERLSQCYVSLLIHLADSTMESQPERALSYATAAVREEPLQDGARARKIKALRLIGEDAAAEKEFADFARLLRSELQIEPAEMVRAALAKTKATKADTVSTEPVFEAKAVDGLIASGRPDQAVDLVASLTPYWIDNGQARGGLDLVQRVLSKVIVRDERRYFLEVSEAELWVALGAFGEAHTLVDQILHASSSRTVRCRAFLLLSRITLYRYRSERALAAAEEALRLSREKDLPYMTLASLRSAALAAIQLGDLSKSERFATELIELAERLGESNTKAWGILTLGEVRELAQDSDGALEALESLDRLAPTLPEVQRVRVLCSASRLREEIGDLDRAEAGYRESIAKSADLKIDVTRAIALTYLGDLQSERGDYAGAAESHRSAIAIRLPKKETLGLATSRRGLGRALFGLGDYTAAKEVLAESARGFVEAEATPGFASALLLLARVEEKLGERQSAIRMAQRSLRLIQGLPSHQTRAIGPSGEHFLFEVAAFLSYIGS
jgi:DNA-binding SARP family transcriptional activator